jgi:hypothetical protein
MCTEYHENNLPSEETWRRSILRIDLGFGKLRWRASLKRVENVSCFGFATIKFAQEINRSRRVIEVL